MLIINIYIIYQWHYSRYEWVNHWQYSDVNISFDFSLCHMIPVWKLGFYISIYRFSEDSESDGEPTSVGNDRDERPVTRMQRRSSTSSESSRSSKSDKGNIVSLFLL